MITANEVKRNGARARFYHEVCEAHLARIIKVDLKSELLTYSIDERALSHALGGWENAARHLVS